MAEKPKREPQCNPETATAGSPQAEGMKGGGGVMKPRVRAGWWELAAVGIAQQEPELLREAIIAEDAKMIPCGGGRAGLPPPPQLNQCLPLAKSSQEPAGKGGWEM